MINKQIYNANMGGCVYWDRTRLTYHDQIAQWLSKINVKCFQNGRVCMKTAMNVEEGKQV